MHAKLMGAAGQGSEFQPRHLVTGAIDDTVTAYGVTPFLMVDPDTFADIARPFCKRQVDRALVGFRPAGDQCPVRLLGLAILEQISQCARGRGAAGQQEDAARVSIEAVHQARAHLGIRT